MRLDKFPKTILFGDAEPDTEEFVQIYLRSCGYNVQIAHTGEELLDRLQSECVSAVFFHLTISGKSGFDLLREIRCRHRDVPVVVFSGTPTTTNVVEAMKSGATDFITKPFSQPELFSVINRALESRPAPSDSGSLKSGDGFLSPRVRELYAAAAWVGPSEIPVLIQGETGSGKEVLARHLHALSPRGQKPFIKLNCAALPAELVESELFGYERGAFTGAFQRKPGMFEQADGGTLLLDEIGDMDYRLQAKLLQVLQDHEFQRLGGNGIIRVNVRVIAATHQDLEKLIAAGKFRQDLFYRLDVVTLEVPALRHRREDIMILTKALLRKHAVGDGPLPEITRDLEQAMMIYEWPGNVRELENVVRKLLVLGNADGVAAELNARAARKTLSSVSPLRPAETAVDSGEVSQPILAQVTRARAQAETEVILAALNSTRWNRKDAAILLEIDYKALLYKMKKLGIEDKMTTMPAPKPHRVTSAGEFGLEGTTVKRVSANAGQL